MDVKRSRWGKALMVVGCIWYVLAFFWLPPLTILFFWAPAQLGMVVLRAEFVMSATLAAVGAIVWRRAIGKPSTGTYVLVFACAGAAIFGVFFLYDWI